MENKSINYIMGLDIGIGSVGWAVINTEAQRIEDYGVRLFDSGEIAPTNKDGKLLLPRCSRDSQERRGFRSTRRLYRRRAHRIERLKKHFILAGLTTEESLAAYYEKSGNNPLMLRMRGLTEKLTAEELAAAMLHIAKHRGYNDFYRIDDPELLKDMTKEQKKEYTENCKAVEAYEKLMAELPAGYTPAQMFLSHPQFATPHGLSYHNGKDKSFHVLVPRNALKEEAMRIFAKQKQFYPEITDDFIDKAADIMFTQRDFEVGPGNPDDPHRKYTGFLDTVGKCQFYKDLNRGARYTVLGDLYTLVNRLSQNRYLDADTGELVDNGEAYRAVIEYALRVTDINMTTVKKILKEYGIDVLDTMEGKGQSLNSCIAFLRLVRNAFEAEGYHWDTLIAEDLRCMEPGKTALLNRVGIVLSENRTPSRRVRKLCEIEGITNGFALRLANAKTNGVSKVSYRYMSEAVEAFEHGETYGNFQARFNRQTERTATGKRFKKLPPITDEEYLRNPVVLRSINETRKIINAVIEIYGSPAAINLEVASDLARSFTERDKIYQDNQSNQKATAAAAARIRELLGSIEESTPAQIERYKLGESQHWVCPYCGQPISMERAIEKGDRSYEVDHIVPYSLILDNTLTNKVLVHASCNQHKGQRTPLMYLTGEEKKRFVAWANAACAKKEINKRKLQYLLQPTIYDTELMSEWKSRNINDTRYIAKYLVRYLEENLLFAGDSKKNVYAVKGAVTSRLRRVWLNRNTWGDDKTTLRKESNLHHAVDAVVIANCLPQYVELAEQSMRLWRIYKEAGKQITPVYQEAMDSAVENLFRYYQMPKERAQALLTNINRVPALLPNLREEVDCRFCDCDLTQSNLYYNKLQTFYGDEAFVARCAMPLVSYKPDRKCSGEITAAQAKKKSADNGRMLIKEIGENNTALLDDAKYYCIELYRDTKGQTRMRGIKFSELVNKGAKLFLRLPMPEDYAQHIMYLYKYDYIRIRDKNGHIKFEGYYVSVYDMKAQRICTAERTEGKSEKSMGILKGDSVQKLDVTILGRVGGEISCGRPFSYLGEND